MSPRVWTFHPMIAECEKGDPKAWQAFLSHYTPMVFRLLGTCAPKLEANERNAVWRGALQRMAAEDFACLRGFDHQAEREFLMDLKWFVLGLVSQGGQEADDSIKSARARLSGRSITHQEIILLSLTGYSPVAIEKILTVPDSLVATALTPPVESLDWPRILPEVHAARTSECPPRRTFVRILDGQASWYDKTPAENHMANCLSCLETWISLREADFLRRDTPPMPESDVAEFLAELPLAAAEGRSWAARLLGR